MTKIQGLTGALELPEFPDGWTYESPAIAAAQEHHDALVLGLLEVEGE